jgi:TolB protein
MRNIVYSSIRACVFLLLIIPFSFLSPQKVQGEDVESGLVVHLSTKSNLLPLYLSSFYIEDSGFDTAYTSELEKILSFDFTNNGRTQVLSECEKKKAFTRKEGFSLPFDGAAWKSLGALYVVKARITDKKLSVYGFSVYDNEVSRILDVPLEGELALDRQRIHLLADSIHKSFFNEKGIANTRILYSVQTKTDALDSYKWVAEIWECDYDGANPRQITNEKKYCVSPIYLPPSAEERSDTFFYVSYKQGQPKIYTASLTSGLGRRLTHLRGNQLMPMPSLRRDKVAFICDVGGNPDVFLHEYKPHIGVLGKPRQIFTAFRGAQASPTFSPDGSRIAFVSNKDGAPRIYVMNVSEKPIKQSEIKTTLITQRNRENTCPIWSPDGRMIAYSSMTDGTRQIWLYDFFSEEEQQLTYSPGHKENPSWAHNSSHLVYNAGDEDYNELYIVNVNEQKPVKISSGPGIKRFPCWEPQQQRG